MKRFFYISTLALGLGLVAHVGVSAQRYRPPQDNNRITVSPAGRTVTRNVHVADKINEIVSRGIVDVEYRPSRGGKARVEIRGAQNLLEFVHINDSRGVLDVGWSRNVHVKGNNSVTVIVYSPDVKRFSTMGTGDIRIVGQLESDRIELAAHGTGDIGFDRIKAGELKITARGSGDIDGDLAVVGKLAVSILGSGDVDISKVDAMTVEVAISGTGDAEIDGRTRDAVLKLRGTGDIDAYGLRAENVNATLSGTGDIECYASSSLRAMASGTGSITVGGKPSVVDIRGNRRAIRLK